MAAIRIAAALVLATVSAAYTAGNVAIQIDAERATLDGDAEPNAIVVTSGGEQDAIFVIGLDGTTVNDRPELVVRGVRDLVIRTGDGPDRVEPTFIAEQTTTSSASTRSCSTGTPISTPATTTTC